ncbi:MAG TPA: peptide deformylase [Bacteroidetes bacterium]|nr:peptide deformylase [Bacteroidota bacterium]
MDILRMKSKPVEKIDVKFIDLIQNMFYTMEKASGVGLAAPQINLSKSVAVIDVSYLEEYQDLKPMTLINPEIISSSGSSFEEEGCLSIPFIKAEVERAEKITLKYFDFDLKEVTVDLEGFPARVAQHEIDHLNGILFIDRLPKEKLKEFKKELSLIKKGKVEAEYLLFKNSK